LGFLENPQRSFKARPINDEGNHNASLRGVVEYCGISFKIKDSDEESEERSGERKDRVGNFDGVSRNQNKVSQFCATRSQSEYHEGYRRGVQITVRFRGAKFHGIDVQFNAVQNV